MRISFDNPTYILTLGRSDSDSTNNESLVSNHYACRFCVTPTSLPEIEFPGWVETLYPVEVYTIIPKWQK